MSNELTTSDRCAVPSSIETALTQELARQRDIMLSMAGMLRVACEKIDRLEKQVKRMEKLTPAEAGSLNSLVRARTVDVCREYDVQGSEKNVNRLIREDVRRRFGCAVRELPREDMDACKTLIELWEDTDKLWKIRERKDSA